MTGVLGLILAGGQGQRMGGADKALLRLKGRRLVDLVADRLRPQVQDMAISANGDAARFAPLDLPVLADEVVMGPLAGVLAGLRWARGKGGKALVTVAVDTPFFPADLVARLSGTGPAIGPAIATAEGRPHPTFGFWPVDLELRLAAELAEGRAKAMAFAALVAARHVEFMDASAFGNLNRPEDLTMAEARAE